MRTIFTRDAFRGEDGRDSELSLQCSAETEMDDGCTVIVKSPVRTGLKTGDPHRISNEYQEQKAAVAGLLQKLGLYTGGQKPPLSRAEALEGACPGTGRVLDFITELGAIPTSRGSSTRSWDSGPASRRTIP